MSTSNAVLAVEQQPERLRRERRDLVSKCNSIAWSRSSKDSKPTWALTVADHHKPDQFR